MNDLKEVLRIVVHNIEKGGVRTAIHDSEFVREELKKRGLGPGCHVGATPEFLLEGDHTVEWYAGQLLSIVDSGSWLAMNSYINSLDIFCPEKGKYSGK